MKTVLHLHAVIFCLFLYSFSTSTLAKDLLDADGNRLVNGASYYIIPAERGKGGGLELAKTGGESCPLTVVQAPSETSRGIPARLSTPRLVQYIDLGASLSIEFQRQKGITCQPSILQWTVEGESEEIVKIAPEDEAPLFRPFGIQSYGDDYKLVFCDPVAAMQGEPYCKDLGISVDDDNIRRLVVKDGDPLAVRFVKAFRVETDVLESVV